MTVMIATALAVAVFASFATSQYRAATGINPVTGKAGNRKLTSYYLFVVICVIILASVAGLRYYVGTDFGSYYRNYSTWSKDLIERLQTWDEPGLSVLASLLMFITDDGAAFIFVTAALTVSLFVFTMARHTDDFFFVVMLYIFMSCWSGCFNGVRQYLAAAILFAGHRLIYDRKFIKFCIVVFLAASFHITALIMLPMYFIITTKLDMRKIIFILVSGVALVFSYDFMFELLGVLKDSETGGADTNYAQTDIHPLRIAIAFAPIVVYFFLLLQNVTFSGEENFYMGFVFVRAAVIFGTASSAYLNRAGIYFAPFLPLALYLLTNKFEPKQRSLLKAVILILYAIVWVYIDARKIEWEWMFNRTDNLYIKAP